MKILIEEWNGNKLKYEYIKLRIIELYENNYKSDEKFKEVKWNFPLLLLLWKSIYTSSNYHHIVNVLSQCPLKS
jgi:hypothetical protein